MKMLESLKAWGTDDFKAVFAKEFGAYVKDIPKHKIMDRNGRPFDGLLFMMPYKVKIKFINDVGSEIVINFDVNFDTSSSPDQGELYCSLSSSLNKVTAELALGQ